MTTRTLLGLFLALCLSLLTTACGGGGEDGIPLADDGTDGDVDPALALLLHGAYDLFATESGHVDVSLPEGFFGPSAPPWVGRIELRGLPLGTGGPFELGDTDTVLRRETDMVLPGPDEQAQVPIELVALSLQSVDPITVQTVAGAQEWDVSLTLTGRDQFGALTVEHPNRDVFSADFFLPVRPVLIFQDRGEVREQREFVLPPETLESVGIAVDADDLSEVADFSPLGVPFFHVGPNFGPLQLSGTNMTLRLLPAQPDEDRPLPFVDPGAVLEIPLHHVGRFTQIGDRTTVGEGSLIGPNTFIGLDCVIGRNVLIAEGVNIGDGCVIEDDAIIGGEVQLGAGSHVGPGAQIHRQSVVGPQSMLGEGAYVGARCALGNNVTILDGASLKNGVQLGDQTTIEAGLQIAADAVITSSVFITEDVFLGQFDDESTQHGTLTDLEAAGATILGDVPFARDPNRDLVQGNTFSEVPIDPSNLPPGLQDLQRDVIGAGAGTVAGPIKDRKYVATTYDCDDFASDMEIALTARGYTATFTVYYCWDTVFDGEPDAWRFPWEYKPSILRAHAVTDVHHNGRVIWVANRGRVGINLDFDGDGRVEYATDPNSRALTDGNYRIEVYPSRAAAELAGVVLD